jgi:hypothetical protein
MRRILAVSIATFILQLLIVLPAFASPVGGLSYNIASQHFSFSVAAGVGFGQRDVHVIDDDSIQDELNSSQFLTRINIAPVKYIDFYGLIGAADMQLDDGDYKGSLAPIYGGGIRPMIFPLWLKSNLYVSLDGQYLTTSTEDNDISSKLDQFQASVIFAYVLQSLAPYGGARYDYAKITFEGTNNDMKGDLEIAAFVGCDYFVTPSVFFNVDLTIFSETRIFAGVGYKY